MLPSLPFLTLYSFGLFLTGSSHFLGIPQKRKPTSKSSLWIKACVCKQLFPHCHVLAYVSQNFLVACKCCVLFACGDSRETIRLATRHNSSLIAFFAFVLAAGHESLRKRERERFIIRWLQSPMTTFWPSLIHVRTSFLFHSFNYTFAFCYVADLLKIYCNIVEHALPNLLPT